jgi:hypothetical protein
VSDPKLSDEFYDRWQHLLEDIEMSDVPLEFVREISVNMSDGSVVTFDISTMIAKNFLASDIERTIEEFLAEHDDEVGNIEFHINIRAVAEEVTDKVSKILDK